MEENRLKQGGTNPNPNPNNKLLFLFSVSKHFATVCLNEHDPDFMPCSMSPVQVLWLQMSRRKNRLSSRGSQLPWQDYFASPAKKDAKSNCAETSLGNPDTTSPNPLSKKTSVPPEEGDNPPYSQLILLPSPI